MYATKNGNDKKRTIIELLCFNAALQSINDHSLTVTYNREYE